MQTGGSHFLYEHSPLDVRVVKQARQEKFARARREDSAFAAVGQAAKDLVDQGRPVFTAAMVRARLAELGFQYTPNTVKMALRDEALADRGGLASTRAGWYRLRNAGISDAAAAATAGGPVGGTRATGPVRVALRALLPDDGSGAVARRRDVEAYLDGADIPYSARAVRLAIAELITEPDPEFGRVGVADVVRLRPAR